MIGKKLITFIAALSMTVSLLAGCGSAPENADAGRQLLPPKTAVLSGIFPIQVLNSRLQTGSKT